jgi:two-component system, chemotaxis family, chemotaxis protein CheY
METSMRIVIVDDSKAIRVKLRRYLKELGHEVVGEASNGKEALKVFNQLRPDLITLDVVMPEMDGLTALKEISRMDPKAKTIIVTSAATVSNMMEAREAGAVHFLIKPFTKEKLAEILTKVLDKIQTAA